MSKTYHFALLGRNVKYSKSPDIFEAIFAHTGTPGRFDVVDSDERSLEKEVRNLLERGVQGFSVTIPFKQTIMKLLDETDDQAKRLGAVNSVKCADSRLIGYNTDLHGFALPLKQYASIIQGGRALVLGNGGAASAVVMALHDLFDLQLITIAGRSRSRIDSFMDFCRQQCPRISFLTTTLEDISPEMSSGFQIIINCTPLGGPNHLKQLPLMELNAFARGSIYYDLNYNSDNRMIALARKGGAVVIDGSAMLAGQAVRSFEIWTGEKVSFSDIYDEVFGAKSSQAEP